MRHPWELYALIFWSGMFIDTIGVALGSVPDPKALIADVIIMGALTICVAIKERRWKQERGKA